ncbi:DUF4430 domain-containing protein [Patescibacteria group bacterium]|nr:DUF4430 domain-containing protein [Patescibacteria group bacterium]
MKDHNKRNLSLGLILIIVILIGIWLLFFQEFNKPVSVEQVKVELEEEIKQELILVINNSEEDVRTYVSEFNQGITAFDLLKNKAEELDLTLETKTYDIGVLIETIGDKKNGDDGKYWLYYINNEMPMVAADKKELSPGDKVEFKFEEFVF